MSWWVCRLCGKPPSSHGPSFDIRLHSATDTGDEELGEGRLAEKWGSKFLNLPCPQPALPRHLRCPAETSHESSHSLKMSPSGQALDRPFPSTIPHGLHTPAQQQFLDEEPRDCQGRTARARDKVSIPPQTPSLGGQGPKLTLTSSAESG